MVVGAPGDSSSGGERPWPRLLDVPTAGRYLSVSASLIKALLASGALHRVIVLVGDREVRRTLIDRHELDAMAARWRT